MSTLPFFILLSGLIVGDLFYSSGFIPHIALGLKRKKNEVEPGIEAGGLRMGFALGVQNSHCFG